MTLYTVQVTLLLRAARKALICGGMYLGDVIEEDGDIFGDDVNVASKLEPFA